MRTLIVILSFVFIRESIAQLPHFSISVDSTGVTNVCIHRKFSGTVNVQQFKWNKWVKMEGYRIEKEITDTCIRGWIPLHSGENIIRLQIVPFDSTQETFCIQEIRLLHGPPMTRDVMGGHLSSTDTLKFPHFTHWEIYDMNGILMKKGASESTALDGLPLAGYFLLYDNVVTEFLICNHKDK